ncbi:hypothetical protein [Lentzea flava]|uniref:SseB protein N-terminal domain-containing protein n=1 Tax=Lentzea flava TaxID=103732 RepID=A0ABQ2UYK2_9PSEU|nr:hypothetical protein [Lentzea flava]MCP2202221.1 hypothetical protein [Lentzea flava]GGU57984.1 hypothetical protein GCM10010178_57930 [Lentzea flava]
MNLAELVDRTRVDALDHLERESTIPVVDGLQAQGDLIVIPFSMVPEPPDQNGGRWVPAEGVHLVAGVNGRNPHVLVADPGTCRWSEHRDNTVVENTAPVYLLHPEHGGTGIAPGRWLIRRQWSASGLVAD